MTLATIARDATRTHAAAIADDLLSVAIVQVLTDLAAEIAETPTPSDSDLIAAACQLISAAALLSDLTRALGITPPYAVVAALNR